MPTPDDLARIDRKLQRFWARHGQTFDTVIGVVVLAALAAGAWFVFGANGIYVCLALSAAFVLWRMWVTRER